MVYADVDKQKQYLRNYQAKKRQLKKTNLPIELNNNYYINLLTWKHCIIATHNEFKRRMFFPRHKYEMKIILTELYENWL
jgi:hypothetical protein